MTLNRGLSIVALILALVSLLQFSAVLLVAAVICVALAQLV